MKKKLLIYTENYIFGGLEKFLFDLIENIKDVDIFLIFNDDNSRIKDFALKNSNSFELAYIKKLISLKTSQNRFIQLIYKIVFQFKLYVYRIINHFYLKKLLMKYLDYQNLLIINGGYPAAESCRIAAIVGKKLGFKNILFTILSTPQDYSKIKIVQFLEKRHHKKVFNSVNYFIGNCDLTKNELYEKYKFESKKLKTIYTGIEVRDYKKKTTHLQNDFISLKKKLDEIWIGTVGYLYDIKGHKFLIESLKYLDLKKLNLHCLIVGDGPNLKSLLNLIRENGLENHVIITGKYPYLIDDIYSFIDIFVFPSLQEGLPYTVSEAMMFKLPIVSTEVGGIPEQIQNYVNGILIEPKKSIEIANALEKLISMRDQWEKIGMNNYEKVKALFSIDRMINEYFKLLK
ncbi:MAG: glycosyltransferase [Promethearchaeota archaeon]